VGFLPARLALADSQGFIVSPAFQSVILTTGQAQAQYSLQLTNTTPNDQDFRLSVVDFGSLDDSGGVAFLGAPTSELEHRYGLAAWMSLSTNTVYIAAGKSVQVSVTIANRASLAPGGHYGAILATAVTDTGKDMASDPRVNFRQVLSSLVLLTKDGGINAELKLTGQTVNHSGLRMPSSAAQRFQNTGNVHLVPRGTVVVKDPTGRVVSRGALNEGSSTILPESFRRYDTPLINVAAAWLPGRYQAVTSYRYDGTEQTKTLATGFWYVGIGIVWIAGVIALGCIGLLGWALWRRGRK
jgi:hypothetical protein